MAESNRKSRRHKPPVLSEVMERAKRLVTDDHDASGSSPSSSSSIPAKRRRSPATYHFLKDSVTGQRKTHCEYRPRQSKPVALSAELEHEDQEPPPADIESSTSPSLDEQGTSFETADLADVLNSANVLLQEWRAAKMPKQNWLQRTSILNESWAALRGSLLNTLVSAQAMGKTSCMKCRENLALIRCWDCHTHTRLCGDCDQLVHNSQPFHDRDAFTSGFLKPIPPTVSVDCDGNWISVECLLPSSHTCLICPKCSSSNVQRVGKQKNNCIVVTLRGRFDMSHVLFRCLDCNKEVSTSNTLIAIQLGFWPGSVSSMCYVFDPDVFLHWDLFQKESPGSSERSFLKSLEQFSSRKGRVATINSKAFGSAFKEWKFCQYELDCLRHLDWMKCPACEDTQHSVHVDGNMKLYRFKSAGLRQRECYYGDTFIASNKEVDKHIQKLYQGLKQSTTKESDHNKCGETSWRAAGNTLHKKKNLCETGLEIAGCRHSIAQKAINMMYGEIYGYAHYLQTTYFLPKQVEYFWYDVVCKYWPWLKKHDSQSAQSMKPALSVMYAKAHSWSCQVIWGGRWQNGASATTGEEVEQINSHFSRLGTSTKHMLPEGREELLTEHALQWNRKKVEKLPRSLANRYSKAKIQLSNAEKELSQQLNELQISVDDLTGWKEEIIHVAEGEQKSQPSRKPTISTEEEAFLLKTVGVENERLSAQQKVLCEAAKQIYGQQTYNLIVSRCGGRQEPTRMEADGVGKNILQGKAIAHFKKKMESYHYSISQMIYNMGKLGDSSKQRQRLRRKVSLDKDSLKATVANYNQLVDESSRVILDNIEKGDFPWQLTDDARSGASVSLGTKRAAVDKKMEVSRFKEELLLIKKEMIGFMSFYKDGILPSLHRQKTELQAALSDSQCCNLDDCNAEGDTSSVERNSVLAGSSPDELVLRGKISLLEEGKNFALRQIASGLNAFASVLSDELHSFRELAVQSEEDAGEVEEETEPAYEWMAEEEEDDEADQERQEDGEATNADPELQEFSRIVNELYDFPPLQSVRVSENICVWQFPQEISQSTFNGRNGSNACSLISLLVAYIFSRKGIQIPHEGILPNNLLRILCGCLELGNRMYDICRDSLPNRYLSVQEAAALLSFTDISVTEPLPVRLQDDHMLSTVCGQLSNLGDDRPTHFVNIVINEKTSLFMVTPPNVMYIDTRHFHGTHGAVIVKGTTVNLKAFCQFVWGLETHEKGTYGNLTTLVLS